MWEQCEYSRYRVEIQSYIVRIKCWNSVNTEGTELKFSHI